MTTYHVVWIPREQLASERISFSFVTPGGAFDLYYKLDEHTEKLVYSIVRKEQDEGKITNSEAL